MYAVEVHTNVVGGLSIDEPATDLAVAMAIASSYYERPIGRDIAVIGELGEACEGVCWQERCPWGAMGDNNDKGQCPHWPGHGHPLRGWWDLLTGCPRAHDFVCSMLVSCKPA